MVTAVRCPAALGVPTLPSTVVSMVVGPGASFKAVLRVPYLTHRFAEGMVVDLDVSTPTALRAPGQVSITA